MSDEKTNPINENDFKDFMKSIFNNDNTNNVNPLELETAKIILTIMLNKENLGSTTNLNDEQIEDISDAESVNLIFKSPLVSTYIDSFRIHRRSISDNPENLLKILTSIVGKDYLQKFDNAKEFLGSRFNNR